MEYTFNYDFVTHHAPLWKSVLNCYADQPDVEILEIGSFEGRSTIWFLENILTHDTSKITCIDRCFGEVFYGNIASFAHKVTLIEDKSQVALRDKQFLEQRFDAIYVDGSHTAPHVLEDIILCFPSLKTGGYVIFDDYEWRLSPEEINGQLTVEQIRRQEPKIAINAFLSVFADSMEVVYKAYQVVIRKVENRIF